MQRKSKGLFDAGKWNGVGGKLEVDETPEECVKREVYEETGLRVSSLKFHGTLYFYFGGRDEVDWVVFVFSTETFEGDLRPGEEGGSKMVPCRGGTIRGDVAGR